MRSRSGFCLIPHVARLLLLGIAFAGISSAAMCLMPGNRLYANGMQGTNGGPSANAAMPNPNYIPSGMPNFGVSGPAAGPAGSMCLTLRFNVPPAVNKPESPYGWGGLTLTFNGPIIGGSFIFDPVCPTPQNGTVGTVYGNNGVAPQPGRGKNQSITFSPTVAKKPYYALPTGTAVGTYMKTDYSKSQSPNYSQFAVTIMYNPALYAKGTVPQLIITAKDGSPVSFWVGKPGKQNGGFSSYVTGKMGPGRVGRDYLPVPEPSFLITLLFGSVGLLVFLHKSRRTPQDISRE
jgi:hypothetical protein